MAPESWSRRIGTGIWDVAQRVRAQSAKELHQRMEVDLVCNVLDCLRGAGVENHCSFAAMACAVTCFLSAEPMIMRYSATHLDMKTALRYNFVRID